MDNKAEIKELARDVFVKELKPYIDSIKADMLRFEEGEATRHKEFWLELRNLDRRVIWIAAILASGVLAAIFK